MAKLNFQPMPQPPKLYDPQYLATMQRILQQTFSKVNYTPIEQHVQMKTMSWMGF